MYCSAVEFSILSTCPGDFQLKSKQLWLRWKSGSSTNRRVGGLVPGTRVSTRVRGQDPEPQVASALHSSSTTIVMNV